METDVLVIGTGPAGSMCAPHLSALGVANIAVNRYRWLANAPRAPITNQRTQGCGRDLGPKVEAEWYLHDTHHDLMGENVFCKSLAGEDLGRMKSWGNHPLGRAAHQMASPCHMIDLPQTLFEPILCKTACARRGRQILTHGNQSIAEFGPIFGALGTDGGVDPDKIRANMDARADSNPAAEKQRRALRPAISAKVFEFDAHGVEMNQRYRSGAVVTDGQPEPVFARDPELHAQLTTWPGARLLHAWLYPRAGGKVSTLDLGGKGRFTLLAGPGGKAWPTAAERASAELGLPIQTNIIGPSRPVEDPVCDWARLSEVGASGAVLVRPDHHVSWCMTSLPVDACSELSHVMRQILALT